MKNFNNFWGRSSKTIFYSAVFDFSNQIRRYATPIGCLWYFVNVIFRYIIVAGTGRNVYSDGMKEFTVIDNLIEI